MDEKDRTPEDWGCECHLCTTVRFLVEKSRKWDVGSEGRERRLKQARELAADRDNEHAR